MAFRFEVILELADPPPGLSSPVCNAAFAECEGLEMSIEPRTVREGGNNREQIHLMGPSSYGQLTLRRGMTANLDLWRWFVAAATPGRISTAHGQVTLWDAGGTPQITFALKDCLPTRMRGPSLNAKDGQVAIEEMQLVYALLDVRPAGQGGGFGIGLSAEIGVGSSASAAVGLDVSGGLSVTGSAGLSARAGASLGLGGSASAGLSIG
jgi:phage tail-like protein